MKKLIGAALATVVAVAAPAAAHVTVQPTEARVGSFFRFVVRAPNERDDASTTKVQLKLPPLPFVSFEDEPGWDRKVKIVKLDEPIEVFGEEFKEVPGSVTWSGGKVGPGEFAEFGFSAKVPDEEETLEFPAIQTYSSGEVVRWIGPPDSEEPAALVSVVDVGAGEGEGALAVIADLRAQVAELEQPQQGQETGEDSGVELWVAVAALALAAAALLVAFRTGADSHNREGEA